MGSLPRRARPRRLRHDPKTRKLEKQPERKGSVREKQWRWCVMSRSKSWARGAVLSVAALVIGLGLAACGGDDDGGGGGPKVALLLPETQTTSMGPPDTPGSTPR